MPTKIIKENSDIFSNFICESINNSIKYYIFPSFLKAIRKIYAVNVLPILAKVFKRSLYEPISGFFADIFLKCQYGFRKGLSNQQCFRVFVRKMKKICRER